MDLLWHCLDPDERPNPFSKPKLHQQKFMMIAWWFAIRFLERNQIITNVYCQQLGEMRIQLNRVYCNIFSLI